jgi:serine/threonine-protein kinase
MSEQEVPVYNGRYEIRRHIARGGMAEVYLAHDRLLDRPVALKVLFPELSVDRAFVERFRREAQAAANLTHPNIVSVYDWGEEGNTYFIVMEYVDGRPLSALLRQEGTLLPDRAAGICADVAAALAFAHRNGVIHRDVKPGNVLLTSDGSVKVTDFGIARAANTEENLTQTGAVMGTATYFSPEQAQGTAVDARSDVYSLGVVLYELVTGRPPFAGDNPVSIAYKHVQEEPVPPRRRNPAVPAAFEAIILQAMAKDPAVRYQTAEQLRNDLMRYQQGRQVAARPPAEAPPTQAVPVTTVQQRYVADGGGPATTVLPAAAVAGPPKRRTGLYVVLLLILLALLAVALYFLGKQLGVFDKTNANGVSVPNVIGLDVAQAEAQVTGAGLTPARVLQPSDAQPQNNVFDQDPKAGTSVDRGATVTLHVSSGSATVKVINVVGKNVDDATAALQGQGFNVSQKLAADDKRSAGTVISQDPIGGNTAKQGDTVTITVSTGKEKATVPDVTGEDAASAAAALRNAGFVVGQVNQPSDTADSGTVISTDPSAGSQADKGSKVTMTVSTGKTTTTTAAPSTTTTASTTTTTTASTTTTVATATVPNEVGKSEAAARSDLIASGFKVTSTPQQTSDPTEVGKVIDQSPVGGSVRPKGSTVTIFVGSSA